MDFGEKLRYLRRQNGISQEELADKINVSRQAISKWETGTLPDIENVKRISQFFDCTLDYLLNDDVEIMSKDSKQTMDAKQIIDARQPIKIKTISMQTVMVIIMWLIVFSQILLYVISGFVDINRAITPGKYYTDYAWFLNNHNLHLLVYGLSVVFLALALAHDYFRFKVLREYDNTTSCRIIQIISVSLKAIAAIGYMLIVYEDAFDAPSILTAIMFVYLVVFLFVEMKIVSIEKQFKNVN